VCRFCVHILIQRARLLISRVKFCAPPPPPPPLSPSSFTQVISTQPLYSTNTHRSAAAVAAFGRAACPCPNSPFTQQALPSSLPRLAQRTRLTAVLLRTGTSAFGLHVPHPPPFPPLCIIRLFSLACIQNELQNELHINISNTPQVKQPRVTRTRQPTCSNRLFACQLSGRPQLQGLGPTRLLLADLVLFAPFL